MTCLGDSNVDIFVSTILLSTQQLGKGERGCDTHWKMCCQEDEFLTPVHTQDPENLLVGEGIGRETVVSS